MSMDPDTFQPWAPDASLFQVPQGCADKCPTTSICTLLAARRPQQQQQQHQQQPQAQPAGGSAELEERLFDWAEDEDGIAEQYAAGEGGDAEDVDRWELRQNQEELRQHQQLWDNDWPGPGWVGDMVPQVEQQQDTQHRQAPASTPAAAGGQGSAQRVGSLQLPGLVLNALA
jgi:hypothetical protein